MMVSEMTVGIENELIGIEVIRGLIKGIAATTWGGGT